MASTKKSTKKSGVDKLPRVKPDFRAMKVDKELAKQVEETDDAWDDLKTTRSITLPNRLWARLDSLSEAEERSVNKQLTFMLKKEFSEVKA